MDKHQTLTYYQEHGEEFIERTQKIDFGFLQKRFLNYVPTSARILDFGCGSGRDALFFASQGYDVSALDATPFFVERLQAMGIKARCLLFEEFADEEAWEGIWACASLLHLSYPELDSILVALYKALVPQGILYCSFKKGDFEGIRQGRYFLDVTLSGLIPHLQAVGFEILEAFESEDARKEVQRPWINVIAIKPLGQDKV